MAIEEAKQKFVEKGDIRVMNLNGEPYIIAKWSELKAFLLDYGERIRMETAEEICKMLDKTESEQRLVPDSTSLWRLWKQIRNSIRDKYVLSSLKKGRGK